MNTGDTVTFENTDVGSTGAIQSWTAPEDGIYRITAFGAQGGQGNAIPGKGAKVSGRFPLLQGERLLVLVGQRGGSSSTGGGGGGSFVVKESATGDQMFDGTIVTPLIIAGGGGGSSADSGSSAEGVDGTTDGCGTVDGDGVGNFGCNGEGGENGLGGGNTGGGGGGYFTDGIDNGSNSSPGHSFLSGGEGASYSSSDFGGFGGGGTNTHGGNVSGSAGGGYSGGAGGNRHGSRIGGGGGGSFNSGTNKQDEEGAREGHGLVEIQLVEPFAPANRWTKRNGQLVSLFTELPEWPGEGSLYEVGERTWTYADTGWDTPQRWAKWQGDLIEIGPPPGLHRLPRPREGARYLTSENSWRWTQDAWRRLYYEAVMDDAPVAYWRMGDSDSSMRDMASEHDGTHGDVSVEQGPIHPDAEPNSISTWYTGGEGSGSEAPSHPDLNAENSDLTVEFWIYLDALDNNMAVIGMTSGGGWSNNGWAFYVRTASGAALAWNVNGSNFRSGNISTGEWHHIVITQVDGGLGTCYLNTGIIDSSNFPSISSASSDPLRIAEFTDLVPLTGRIAEVAIYNHVLSPERISHHYALGLNG